MQVAFTLLHGRNSFREGKEKQMQATATKTMINLDTIKEVIAAKMDAASFSSWIAPLTFELSDNTLTLVAQNQFSADFIGSVHLNSIKAAVAAFGLDVNICVRNAMRVTTPIANDNNVQTFAPMPRATVTNDASFDKFIASDENAFVLSACKKIASGAVTFSPLFIYGAAGCGKSLLAECISGASNDRVVMMSGAQFVSEFTRSLHEHSVFAFKDFCRNCDTFILDDVQTLAGKRATCEEFLALIVDLRNAGKNVVLTADASPNNLTGFDRRAQSLMASGLVADIVSPNTHVKTVMLRRAGVASDVASAIASRIAGDGHLVAGVVNKIRAYCELMGGNVDIDVAQRLLADTLQKSKTPMAMVKSMCEKLGVSYDAVCGNGRSRGLVLARQMMMTVLKSATGLSLTEIGNMVGGRNHATVLYGISQIEKLKQSDLVLNAQIAQMVAECK